MKSKHLLLVLTILYVIAIFISAILPSKYFDKANVFRLTHIVLHAIAFAVLGFLLSLTLKNYIKKFIAPLAFMLCAAIGICIEFAQMLSPSRHFRLADWEVDMLAAIIGILLAAFVSYLHRVSQKKK